MNANMLDNRPEDIRKIVAITAKNAKIDAFEKLMEHQKIFPLYQKNMQKYIEAGNCYPFNNTTHIASINESQCPPHLKKSPPPCRWYGAT